MTSPKLLNLNRKIGHAFLNAIVSENFIDEMFACEIDQVQETKESLCYCANNVGNLLCINVWSNGRKLVPALNWKFYKFIVVVELFKNVHGFSKRKVVKSKYDISKMTIKCCLEKFYKYSAEKQFLKYFIPASFIKKVDIQFKSLLSNFTIEEVFT